MPGERDRPDPSLIINRPRQRRAGPATNRNDNVSKDKDTINILQRLTQAPGTVSRQRSQSVEIEEIPDEDKTPANTPPRNDNHLLEHVDDDDDDDFLIPRQKKARYTAPQKRNRVQSDDDDEPSPSASRPSKRVNAGAELSDKEQDEERGVEKENETDKGTKKGERTWTSPIYAFFKPNPVDTTHDGRPCTKFTCAASNCKSKGKNGRIVRRYLDKKDDTSTKNLRTHAVHCWGEDLVKQAFELGKDWDGIRAGLQNAQMKDGRLTAVFERTGKGKVTYSDRPHTYKEARVKCVKWIAESMRPISTVDDPGFHTLMKTGRPHYRIPHSRTVGRDVHEVFKKAKERIKKLLKEYDGQLSFATDAWTGTNGKPFVAVTVHLEHNDESLCLVLDIVEVPVSHSGANLAKAFADILMEFEITNKFLAVTCDNASSNDTMVDELAKLITSFKGPESRVRCFAHIVNLVVKIILRQFDSRVKGKKQDRVTEDAETALAALADALEEELEDSDDEVEDDGDDEDGEEDSMQGVEELEAAMQDNISNVSAQVKPIRTVLTKLRKLANAVKNQTTSTKQRWLKILEALSKTPEGKKKGITVRMIPRDVATRWNSTYDMLKFAYAYREAIDELTGDRYMGLRDCELTEAEWEIVRQLRDSLKLFKTVTLAFSSDTPSLASVIPAMDTIDKELTKACLPSSGYSTAVRAALSLGKDLLNKYYSLTDTSDLYRIAIILHPGLKLRYLKKAGWTEDWIQEAIRIVKREFSVAYAAYAPPRAQGTLSQKPKTPWDIDSDSGNESDSSSSSSECENWLGDELERYLAAPRVKGITNPLEWWHANKTTYPRLFRMARDYLNIPATSVAVERLFSRGRLVLSYIRNRLSGETTQALLCLGAWFKLGLIKQKDLEDAASLPDAGPTKAAAVDLTL